MKTLKIKKSKESRAKYQEIQKKLILPIVEEIKECISEVTKNEKQRLEKFSEEYGKELSQRFRLEK